MICLVATNIYPLRVLKNRVTASGTIFLGQRGNRKGLVLAAAMSERMTMC
jgi:hypothetical protein